MELQTGIMQKKRNQVKGRGKLAAECKERSSGRRERREAGGGPEEDERERK